MTEGARIPELARDVAGEVAEGMRARRRGELMRLDRLLLHSPPLADGWNSLLRAVREELSVEPAVRELVILRIASVNHAQYEWETHLDPARTAGLSDSAIQAISTWTSSDLFTPPQRAALAYADAMTRDVVVDDEMFAQLAVHFASREIVELTAIIGTYNLVSRFVVALNLLTES
jgi:4-carboxymuconolactone decarboxylase